MSEGLLDTTGSQLAHPISRIQGMWLLGLPCAVSVLFALGGEPARLAMRYERAGVLAGDYWRLITGHLVHGSLAHLLLNMAGLGLIAALFSRDYTLRQWLIVLLLSAMTINAGFVLFEPQLQWYVGLSGILHGALAAGTVAWWRHETKPLALALTVGLIGKLTWEQWQGALPLSGDMPVIVNAHLYGAIGGLVGAFGIYLRPQRWSVRRRSL